MKKDDKIISFRVSVRGNKDIWMTFVNKIRENKRENKELTVWKVLEPLIREYIKNEKSA